MRGNELQPLVLFKCAAFGNAQWRMVVLGGLNPFLKGGKVCFFGSLSVAKNFFLLLNLIIVTLKSKR